MSLACIVLAGGEGKRFRSKKPKVAHDFLGLPLVMWPIRAAVAAGAENTVVVVSPGIKDQVAELVGAKPGIQIGVQQTPKGTGDAVAAGLRAGVTADTVLIVCGDTPLLQGEVLAAAASEHERSGAVATVLSMQLDDAGSYGRIVRDASGQVQRITEVKDADQATLEIREVNTGAWLFDKKWLVETLPQLSTDNAQGELYLTDLLEKAASSRKAAAWIVPDSGDFLGINDRAEFADAWDIAQQRIVCRHQRNGVSLLGSGFHIEAQVEIAEDTIIYGPATLTGQTVIDHACRIETGSVLHNARLACHAQLFAYCVLEDCDVAHGAKIGPWARLRPGADIRKNAKVGNFVEVKKSIVHEGAKVNHLTYIGDADIGAGANIGAGTITCNYDGFHKFKTRIGEKAFIGSNSALVAPVQIGAGAIVGAGSTVTKDVPANALGLARAEQKNVDGFAARFRKKNEKKD